MVLTCCVTGHRDIPADKIDFVKQELRREILQAIKDGYIYFISGFAEGVDLLFTSIVAELKTENNALKLEAALPYRNRIKSPNKLFQELLRKCDIIGIHSETYSSDCFMKRNCFVVNNAQRVIAVYDGRKHGGTFATIHYASNQGKELRIIML